MTVPYVFANATSAIPLSQLDSNFATAVTIGNVAVQLGNTATTLGNVTMANVTISSVSTPITPTQGGTGNSSAFTANAVVYAPTTSTLATGSALIFDGTNLGVGVTPSAWLTTSGIKTLQVGGSSLLGQTIAGSTWLSNNVFLDSGSTNKYIYTGYAQRYAQSSDGTHQWYTAPSGTAGNTISFTQSLAVGKGTTLALEGATSQTGTGVSFPATQNPSSNANTLDDYEKGTWTPSLGGNTTYIANSGYYTKIGRVVNVQFEVQVNSIGSGSTLSISGLPFASGSVGNGQGGSVGYFSGAANSIYFVTLRLDSNSTTISLATLLGANIVLNTSADFFTSGTRILGTMTYMSN